LTRKEFIKLTIASFVISPLAVLFGKAVKKEEPRVINKSANKKIKFICIDNIECKPITHITYSGEFEYKDGLYVPIDWTGDTHRAYPEHVYYGCVSAWGT